MNSVLPQLCMTKKLRAAARVGGDVVPLRKLFGKPLRAEYAGSCQGEGDDGIWTYRHFRVFTFRPYSGKEIYMGAEYRP